MAYSSLFVCSSPIPMAAPPVSSCSSSCYGGCRCSFLFFTPFFGSSRLVSDATNRKKKQVVCMAPQQQRVICRNPLDFPIEWTKPRPASRPDVFPQFGPMKTPLPLPPLPFDPPGEEEEEEEERRREEEEQNPDTEEDQQIPEDR